MKYDKLFLLALLMILLMPFVVNAKEFCNVVSGNGMTIGSEIACGSERFYVIERKDDNIKMLSKYNLYVGSNYNKIKLDIKKTYIKIEADDTSWNNAEYYFEGQQVSGFNEWKSKINSTYNKSGWMLDNISPVMEKSDQYTEGDKTYYDVTYKFYPQKYIEDDTDGYALQNELARGVTGDKGNANYPLYATLVLFPDSDGYSLNNFISSYNVFKDGYTNFEFKDGTTIKNYLNKYKTNLNDFGYEISSVDMINMEEITELVKSINNKDLPLEEWYDNSAIKNEEDSFDDYYIFGDLKDYVPDNYSWLWGTTYWTKTLLGSYSKIDNDTNGEEVYFVSSTGEICSSESDECGGAIPRAGLRPVVTITSDNLKYLIRTKTDGNGTIEVVDSAYGNDTIQFKVESKKGYKLTSVTITTDSGEKIEFREGEITNNNGIYSIDKNKFTMPFENVTIEARWGIINPETGQGILGFLLIITCLGVATYKFKKKKKTI